MEKIISRQPIKLIKKNSYPTYQLHAVIGNSKTDVETALKICILETMSWLRKRFRDLDIPEEIIFPEPEDYILVNMNDFKSFRINDGYLVDVVYIKESGIWAFHLVEPDLGPDPGNIEQIRQPIPGRVFETNISYKINNGQVECGFKTICSEPKGINAPCEVFRPAVVKSIVRNELLGLKQILPIIEEPQLINNISKIKTVKEFINNTRRQLPLVIIAEYIPKLDIEAIRKDLLTPTFNYTGTPFKDLYTEPLKVQRTEPLLPIVPDNIIKYRMSFAQFAILSLSLINDFNRIIGIDYPISEGDIRIIYPLQFNKESKLYKYNHIPKDQDKLIKLLDDELQEYPKHKNIEYGNISFLNEARIEERQQTIKISNSIEEIVTAKDSILEDTRQNYIEEINKLNKIVEQKDEKILRVQWEINSLKSEKENQLWEIQSIMQNHDMEKELWRQKEARYKQLLDRPRKPENVSEWVEKHFKHKLIFHQRAIDLMNKTLSTDVDMDLLCDALEFLAFEFRNEFLGKISISDKNRLCKEKYDRPFEVVPSGDGNIINYDKEYKIKYGFGKTGRVKEVPLDLHLRVGTDNRNLLRIYFYFDVEDKLVVVGSLPKHLRTTSFR